MTSPLYRGSVKDVLGPVKCSGQDAVLFDYSDAFSVFDWGKMPDALPRKGEALATLAAHWFESLERPATWKDFSKTPEALALRKGNRFGVAFNELGEKLQSEGLRTHYLGALAGTPSGKAASLSVDRFQESDAQPLAQLGSTPAQGIVVRQVSVVKPRMGSVLGRSVPDYSSTWAAPTPRLVACEVVFRFGCPAGSSLIERVEGDPSYLASRGFPEARVHAGAAWEFPVLELFTKLETTDRPLGMNEGLSVSGLPAEKLQELLLTTAWVAGWLRSNCARAGLELADGKLEWGVDEKGRLLLVDAIGPDELRLLKGGVQLSKEFLRGFYRGTPWYTALGQAKSHAEKSGASDWKRGVTEAVPKLPAKHREAAVQVYLSLTNHLTGKSWFPEAWSLDRVVSELREISE